MALAIDRVPSQRRGLSMAQFQTFHELGNVVGAITLGSLLDLMNKNFSAMYLVSAAVVSSGLVFFGIFGKEHQRTN
jgi:predicted MFS family arabinose efflux permease